jgi:hypothetical protein
MLDRVMANQMAAQDADLNRRAKLNQNMTSARLVELPGVTNKGKAEQPDGSVVPVLDYSGSLQFLDKQVYVQQGIVQTKAASIR